MTKDQRAIGIVNGGIRQPHYKLIIDKLFYHCGSPPIGSTFIVLIGSQATGVLLSIVNKMKQ
jgi:hypothetical protein